MRLDKYLKTARILKRREAAKELALQGRIWVNERVAKPSTELKIGDTIRIRFGARLLEIRVLDIQKQVNFLGRISQERVREEMMKSDCFVLSSNFETFGVVLIEALACGLPLIATKCGGPEDIVNEQNGILIDVENQLQLEDAMITMYKNAHNYDKEKLRNYAKEKFGEKTFIENVIKYYKVRIDNEE